MQEEKTTYPGVWGDWGDMVKCPYGSYINGARVRYEDPIGDGDDTALNGLIVSCKDPKT